MQVYLASSILLLTLSTYIRQEMVGNKINMAKGRNYRFLLLIILELIYCPVKSYYIQCGSRRAYSLTSCNIKNMTDNSHLITPGKINAIFIRSIHIGFSNITKFPSDLLNIFPYLNSVTIHCSIRSVRRVDFVNGSRLRILDLGFANNIDRLENYTFAGAFNLEYLDLAYNFIDRIDEWTLFNLTKLLVLRFEGNRLSSLVNGTFQSTPMLEVLDLSRNNIESIARHAFYNLIKLKNLSIRRNRLTKLITNSFIYLENLERLEISENQLGIIELHAFRGLKNLLSIDLSRNQLTHLPSNMLIDSTSLNNIFLSWNQLQTIKDIQFNRYNELKILDLSFNLIEDFTTSSIFGISSLEILELQNSGLQGIRDQFHENRTYEIKSLDISNNNLSESIDLNWFKSLKKLQLLRLQGIGIANLNVTGIRDIFPDFSFIDLAFNNWNCSVLVPIIKQLESLEIGYNLNEETMFECYLVPLTSTFLQVYELSKANFIDYK